MQTPTNFAKGEGKELFAHSTIMVEPTPNCMVVIKEIGALAPLLSFVTGNASGYP